MFNLCLSITASTATLAGDEKGFSITHAMQKKNLFILKGENTHDYLCIAVFMCLTCFSFKLNGVLC